jgi:hypothetical protein
MGCIVTYGAFCCNKRYLLRSAAVNILTLSMHGLIAHGTHLATLHVAGTNDYIGVLFGVLALKGGPLSAYLQLISAG